ncbi:MAG: hypothetical protein HY907_03790 [Deltaproteobacteria bacterium]|nr:hypothetical protein [Deltaproteobacteria bacterium]
MRLRPLVRATLPSLILESRLPRIPPSAVTRLAALAERQSEGRFDGSSRRRTYFGATYFTFPLQRVRAAFAGQLVREMGARELSRALGGHPLLRLRLLRMAREEAERRIAGVGAGKRRGEGAMAPGTARITSVVSSEDDAVVFEVGVEIPCAAFGGRDGTAGEEVGAAGSG